MTRRVAKAAVDTPLYILRRGSLYHFYVHYEHRRPYLRQIVFPPPTSADEGRTLIDTSNIDSILQGIPCGFGPGNHP